MNVHEGTSTRAKRIKINVLDFMERYEMKQLEWEGKSVMESSSAERSRCGTTETLLKSLKAGREVWVRRRDTDGTGAEPFGCWETLGDRSFVSERQSGQHSFFFLLRKLSNTGKSVMVSACVYLAFYFWSTEDESPILQWVRHGSAGSRDTSARQNIWEEKGQSFIMWIQEQRGTWDAREMFWTQ